MNELFFLISKISWALLSPGNLIIFILFLGSLLLIFNKVHTAKLLLIPTGLIAFVLMVYPVGDYLIKPLESRFSKPQTMPKNIDGIIVLGGGEDLKRSLSWNVAELGTGGDRYIGAAHLAKLYPQAPVIFTGGSGLIRLQNTAGEASIAKQLLTTIGVDPSRLIIESKSRNTYENFLYTKALLPKQNGTYLLVTSAFHMPRAVGIARMQNVNVIAYPVDYRSNSDALRKIDFDFIGNLNTLEPAWREWIGLTVYYLTGKTNRVFPSSMRFETTKQMKAEQ